MKQLKIFGLAAVAATALVAVLGVAGASATSLEVAGTPKNTSVEITASLKSGTTAVLRNTSGIAVNTCTASHLTGSTSNPFVGASVTGPVAKLSFESCTNPVQVHLPGKLEITHIPGTTNGTVASEEAEVTVASLIGTLTCTTGATTNLGTLTGVKEGNATLDINAVINCTGVGTAKWEATYSVTSPSGLGVSDVPLGTALEVGGTTKNEAVAITGSLKSGTSSTLQDTFGSSMNTCTASHVTGSTSSPFAGTSVTGPVSSLSFSNCTRPVTVHAPGKLEITHIPGTTNGTVASEEAEVTVDSPVGTLNCKTGATTNLGTLTGVKEGSATLDVNAVIICTTVGTTKWEATYSVTSPSGLGVST